MAQKRTWRQRWASEDRDEQTTATLEDLVVDGVPVLGALILTVQSRAGGAEWISLPHGELERLHRELGRWLGEQSRGGT